MNFLVHPVFLSRFISLTLLFKFPFYIHMQNYNSKISDFGLARLGPTGEESHVTTRIMGTYGYVAPEYVSTGNHICHCLVKYTKYFGYSGFEIEIMINLEEYIIYWYDKGDDVNMKSATYIIILIVSILKIIFIAKLHRSSIC